jgi:hypothetical protein
MKTLLVLISAIIFSIGVFAQEAPKKDCIIMKDGKMIVMKDGKTAPLMKDTIIAKGTIVTVDGSILKKDGTKMTLKNDEYIDISGKIASVTKQPSN